MMARRQSGDEAAGIGRAWEAIMQGRLKSESGNKMDEY